MTYINYGKQLQIQAEIRKALEHYDRVGKDKVELVVRNASANIVELLEENR
jgi:hypothetical protein